MDKTSELADLCRIFKTLPIPEGNVCLQESLQRFSLIPKGLYVKMLKNDIQSLRD